MNTHDLLVTRYREMPLKERMAETRHRDLILLSEARDRLTRMELELRQLMAQLNYEHPSTMENAVKRAHLHVERALETVGDRLYGQGDKPMVRS